MFFFFSNRLGCLPSLLLSLAVTVVLVGYVLTLRLEARDGHPLRPATGPDLVREGDQPVDRAPAG